MNELSLDSWGNIELHIYIYTSCSSWDITDMEVSINEDIPKSSNSIGFSIIFHYKPFTFGYPHLWNPPYQLPNIPNISSNVPITASPLFPVRPSHGPPPPDLRDGSRFSEFKGSCECCLAYFYVDFSQTMQCLRVPEACLLVFWARCRTIGHQCRDHEQSNGPIATTPTRIDPRLQHHKACCHPVWQSEIWKYLCSTLQFEIQLPRAWEPQNTKKQSINNP